MIPYPPAGQIALVPGPDGRMLWSVTVAPGTPDEAVIALAHEAIRLRDAVARTLASDPASDKQLWLLKKLAAEQNVDLTAWVQDQYERPVEKLTKEQASALISELKGDPAPGTPPPPRDDPGPEAPAAGRSALEEFDDLAGDDRPDPDAVAADREKIRTGLDWLSKRGWEPARQLNWLRKWGPTVETVGTIPAPLVAFATAELRAECAQVKAAQDAQRAPVAANAQGVRR